MATGLAATGVDHVTGKRRSLADYRQQIRQVIAQAKVDIVLMSASTNDLLTIQERLFDNTAITPAARANDTTDIHLPAGGTYGGEPSRPFRTATLEQIQSGKVDPTPAERKLGADLGLYSITPNNKLDFDYVTVQAYKDFRIEAERGRVSALPRSLRPQRLRRHLPGRPGAVHQRPDRPHAGGRAVCRAARLSQARLPRPEGDGGSWPPTTRTWSRAFSAGPAAPPTTRSRCWPRPKSTARGRRCTAERSTTPSTSFRSSRSCDCWPTGRSPPRKR